MYKSALVALSLLGFSTAHALSNKTAINEFTTAAHQRYVDALTGAQKIDAALEAFLKNPSEVTLQEAKSVWIEARKIYSQTEVYRFFSSPIDDEDGPEGLINAWPLDEAYIDMIIERADLYPQINTSTLSDLNEKDGEKNIATGYHAIEFLLWGKDEDANGPGQRPVTDYTTSNLASRRAEYLRAASSLLIENLTSVTKDWENKSPYVVNFKKDEKAALTAILTGVTQLAGSELSQERMFVAVDTGDQEEEHSCFSDTTHFDILYNFTGVKNVLSGKKGLIVLIRQKDAGIADEIVANLEISEKAILAIPAPFDQAILKNKTEVVSAITALENLSESVRQGAVVLGLNLP